MKSTFTVKIEIEHDATSTVQEIAHAMVQYLNNDIDELNPNDFGVTKVDFKEVLTEN